MIESKTKERRIWFFPCIKCGKGRAQSHKKRKAMAGLCQKCRRNQVPENQETLFGFPVKTDPSIPIGEVKLSTKK